jgi:hypothetical protein
VPNFVTNLLEGREVSPEEEEEIKWAASSLYSGGADTVRVTVSWISGRLIVIFFP